ncbi:hypothetical protein K492DRAFT_81675 [Lichtheimia hyalospora FSU 10163]|nr:hypothetical protein K492DRAFT_81675 [Lichtheimia hyalospora FSU 10163]
MLILVNKDGLGGSQCEWLHHVVGGTIRIYGAPNGPSKDALIKIVVASVYTLWSLWLEAHVLNDSQIRVNGINRKQQILSSSPTTPTSPLGNTPAARKGVLWWLLGSSKETTSPVVQISKKAIRRSASFMKKDINSTPTGLPLDNDQHRFAKIHKQLESARISSSPYCNYGVPQLISRLQDEEDGLATIRSVMRESINNKSKSTTVAGGGIQRRSSLLSIISHYHQDHHSQQQPSLRLPQSIAAYSPLRVPGRICDKKLGLDSLYLDTQSVDTYMKHQHGAFNYTCYPIGCPQHPCAGPLLITVDFFSFGQKSSNYGDMPLGQAIQRWCEHANKSCKSLQQQQMEHALQHSPNNQQQSPTATSDSTESSSSSVAAIHSPSTPSLSFHGCDKSFKDHVMSFMHGSGKVQVYLSDEDDDTTAALSSDSSKTLAPYRSIDMWTTCSECNATTKRLPISIATYHYSLAKFMELILYDKHFTLNVAGVTNTLCVHAQQSKTALIRCFKPHGSTISVRMTYEPTTLYELRPPRLQVMPDTTTPWRKGSGSKDDTMKRRLALSQRTLDKWKAIIATEVDEFFDAIAAHIEVMERYIQAESKREQRDAGNSGRSLGDIRQQLRARETELNQMRRLFLDVQRSALVHELNDTPMDQLNDFRRFFAVRSSSVLSQLSQWQEKWCHDLMDGCAWNPPDYIESDRVHSFPGSSVVVREDEPSSLIAYTLSSNEYLDELQHQRSIDNRGSIIAENAPSEPSDASTNIPKPSNDPNVVDRYHSIITRKYVAPTTGASSETASFRSMVIETVKANAEELHYQQSKKMQGIKKRLSHAISSANRTKEDGEEDVQQRIMLGDPSSTHPTTAGDDNDKITMEEIKKTISNHETKPLPKGPDEADSTRRISPHIKHKFTHNDVEFTCTTYYAQEFENLRRQSGIDQLLVQSLTRCTAWKASGGKSKSHFYKTQDDRFVIKEMVNAWNNIEKESILKFAPKYFEHMRHSEDTPSMLAKIFGFYTIRIRSIEDKRVLLNLDVLVMEHLFYGATPQITQRFDFKGLRDRHVEECLKQPHQPKSDTTLWDGDWIEGFRLTIPVHEHSKQLLKKAIMNDTEFLASRNIMDYSLLLGIDEAKKELTVGIVDFIGAYTWYKKMENKSKSTLHPYKEVTVVPPREYRWRFCRIVDDYFVTVPGKFDLIQPNQMFLAAWI